MSTLLKFEKDADVLQFEDGGDYPANRKDEVLQVSDRTAGGTLQTETLGVNLKSRTINFNLMSKTDYDGLLNWFLNIVNAGSESFTFTDEYGVVGDVVFVNNIIDFDETSFELFSGSIILEYV